MIRRGEILGLLAAAFLFEVVCARYLPWALYFDLPLVAALYVGWYSTPVAGAFYGTLFGLSQDLALLASYWGLNGFSKTWLGFLGSYLSRWVVSEGTAVRAAVILLAAFADGLNVFGLLYFFGADWNPVWWREISLKAFVTGLGGALFFTVADRLRFPEKDFRTR